MSTLQGAEWASIMSGYETNSERGDQIETQMSSLFQKLGCILEKKLALFWHTKSFDRYVRELINPYMLCIQIFPNIE